MTVCACVRIVHVNVGYVRYKIGSLHGMAVSIINGRTHARTVGRMPLTYETSIVVYNMYIHAKHIGMICR